MTVEGPRTIRPDEFQDLDALLNRTFRDAVAGDMLEQFPLLLNPANTEHMFIFRDETGILSHAGMLMKQGVIEGVNLKFGLVGAVATAEEARGHGYATKLMNTMMETAAREGTHLAWISGGRGLYTSRGSTAVGRFHPFIIKAGPENSELDLREIREEDLPAMDALHRREPVRLLRTREDIRATFKCRWILNGPGHFYGVWRNGRMEAYLAAREPHGPGRPAILVEFAGDRALAATATPVITSRMNVEEMRVDVAPEDLTGQRAFAAVGTAEEEAYTGGTMLVLQMAGLMEALRPRFAECIGREFAQSLQFSESGQGPGVKEGAADRLRIERGEGYVEIIGRGPLAQFIFGGNNFPELPEHEGSSDLLKALRPALPLPAPWYGLDYC